MYHTKFKEKVFSTPASLGTKLGRWAIYHHISVAKIAKAIGATRQSVYNWMKGEREIFTAYRPAVTQIINCLQSSQTAEEAWGKICQEFNLSN